MDELEVQAQELVSKMTADEKLRKQIQTTHGFSNVVKEIIKSLIEEKYFINDL